MELLIEPCPQGYCKHQIIEMKLWKRDWHLKCLKYIITTTINIIIIKFSCLITNTNTSCPALEIKRWKICSLDPEAYRMEGNAVWNRPQCNVMTCIWGKWTKPHERMWLMVCFLPNMGPFTIKYCSRAKEVHQTKQQWRYKTNEHN